MRFARIKKSIYKRRERILRDYIKGIDIVSISEKYDISRQRVYQIVETHGKIFIKDREIEVMREKFRNERRNLYLREFNCKNNVFSRIDSDVINKLWEVGTLEYHKKKGNDLKYIREKYGNDFILFRKGWPDYLIRKDGKWIAIEVKHKPDKMSIEQVLMMRFFKSIGIEYKIVGNDIMDLE